MALFAYKANEQDALENRMSGSSKSAVQPFSDEEKERLRRMKEKFGYG